MIGSTVNAAAMSAVLAEFAQQVGAGPDKRVIAGWDGAGWHTANDLVVPEGIHLVQLLPYSPELPPAECVWPLIGEVVANRDFRDLAHLVDVVGDRRRELSAQPRLVRDRTLFWWWPRIAS